MLLNQCDRCKHYNFKTRTCPAFPDKIPQEIIGYNSGSIPPSGFKHDKKHPKQVGDLVFEDCLDKK